MANEQESGNGEPAAQEPDPAQSKIAAKSKPDNELPAVESPSITPATKPVVEPVAEPKPASETVIAFPPPAKDGASPAPRFRLNARHKRNALLAASVTLAAAFGAVVGAVAARGVFAPPAQSEVARVEESKAMRQTIARLSKDLATLKTTVEAANETTYAQIVKITDALAERFSREAADITGSISAPKMVSPAPLPKPAQRVAAVEPNAPARPPVVLDWIIRDVRDGYVYVQGHGDIYRVALGAPLPGLGAVEQIKRQDGRWIVVTRKGIIVSLRDRRYFESFRVSDPS